MSSRMTPSQLLEIRRVKAMVAGAGTTMDPQCFLGPAGPPGPPGPAGLTGNYGIPASIGYVNSVINTQLIANGSPTIVTWAQQDINFSQGTTGLSYSLGKLYNYSTTDNILANVTGFISFSPNVAGVRSVYGQVNGVAGNIYGYTQVSAASSVNTIGQSIASTSTIVPFAFNVYLPASSVSYSYFEIYAYQNSGATAGLTINSSTSRMSITRINTTMVGKTGPTGPPGPSGGETGPTGPTGAAGSLLIGNTIRVDSVNGNDFTASPGGSPFGSIQAAITAITSLNLTNQTIWVLPGTYFLTTGITIPATCSISGLSMNTVLIKMVAQPATPATLVTMGEGSMIENCTLMLTSASYSDLVGILFSNTTPASVRNCTITVNNSVAPSIGGINTIVAGILSSGTSILNEVFDTIININSNGSGKKRGILVTGSSVVLAQGVNIIVALLATAGSIGSCIGVETTAGKVLCYSTIIDGSRSIASADISQTGGNITVGPGSLLVHKNANSLSFTSLVSYTPIVYGLMGNLSTGPTQGYIWPGYMNAAASSYPDNTTPIAYYRVAQTAIITSMYASLRVAPGTTYTVTATVYVNAVQTFNTLTLTDTNTTQLYDMTTITVNSGDLVSVFVSYTGAGANAARDLTIHLYLY